MQNCTTPDAGVYLELTADRESKTFWQWNPSRSLLASIRSYQRWRPHWWALPLCKLAVLRHRFWSIVTAADIPINCQIGEGLLIPHPTGIVIHPEAVIGPNCLIFSGVTIGSRNRGVPTLGAHVDIGTGAKILGAVRIGDHAVIGANAVVVSDVRAGAVVVGVPARELSSSRRA
jgi:serine O-acetyltransferase